MKRRPDLPELEPTGRTYRDDTMRVRLRSPGIERFPARGRSRAGALALALALAAALAAAMAWLAQR